MLKINLKDEEAAIENYRRWIKEVDAAGDPATRRMLEDLLADEEEHAHELEMILAKE
jgi:bacterioferritin